MIHLGNEPPLSVDGGAGGLVDRRRLSVQWFSGTILTGLCGAALMGGAVFASLDGETNFATAPEQVESVLRGAISSIGEHLNALRKTDRLPAISEPSVARQVLRVPTTSHVRDREMVRMRPFVRVGGNLSLTTSDLSAKIPAYNPQKLLTDSVGGDDQAPAAEPDAEVSFVECDLAGAPGKSRGVAPGSCDLNSLLSKVKASTQLPLDDVMARVRDTALRGNIGSPTSNLLASADATASLKMSYAAEGEPDAYFGFVPRAVPENVTLLPKTTNLTNGGGDWSEKQIIVKKGETVGSILRELGAAPEEIKAIIAVIGPAALDGGLKDGQKLRVLMTPAGLGHVQPLRVIIAGDSGITAAVALSDVGRYVPVDIRNIDTGVAESNGDEQASDDDSSGVQLYQSLYETALRNNVPKSVIEDLVRIYSYDVDFERKVQAGDNFDVLYSEDETGDRPEVRFASLTVGGETKKYYRFQTADDGVSDYYDETGKSAKKFLVRKPVAVGVETSPFGWRTHPLLHVSELHSGVDWGAPYGTPIFAAGNGEIEEIGLKGGYGKYVRVKHANGYETAYGHMTAFAKGLDVGSKVRQGQVIGFVGSSGMSTGSHVHFEIIVNDRFVDPMRIKLPRGRVLDGSTLVNFEKDRDQLDAVLSHSAPPAPPSSSPSAPHVAQAH
ncbi:MAG TPA: M23 family metallopeptidase [Xanthobacteraceae bacterium]|nr:M23 family metallopeptidase [Xanthobacteraceae bacterium]